MQATKHCHNARTVLSAMSDDASHDFHSNGPCDQKTSYQDMMCKRMRAKHYVKNQGGLDQCLEVHSNRFFLPEVDETQ